MDIGHQQEFHRIGMLKATNSNVSPRRLTCPTCVLDNLERGSILRCCNLLRAQVQRWILQKQQQNL